MELPAKLEDIKPRFVVVSSIAVGVAGLIASALRASGNKSSKTTGGGWNQIPIEEFQVASQQQVTLNAASQPLDKVALSTLATSED